MTVDNEFTVFLDGRELGHGAEWRELFTFDLTPLLSPGRHVLAVRAVNSYSYAGMILGLQIDLVDGSHIEIKSDGNWKVVPSGVQNWEKVTQASHDWPTAAIKAPLGGLPWWDRPQNVNIMPTLHPIKVLFWQSGWFQILLLSVCGITVLTSLSLVGKLALHRKERLLLQRERARIARDIHDDIGSKITQLVLHGEVTQNEFPSDPKLRTQLDLICHDAREVLSVLDEVLWAVNPKRDELRDFTTYMCHYAEQFLKFTPIQCFLDVDTEAPALELTLPLRRGLLMVTKEALNNAVKHSRASELRLQIRCEHGRLTLMLQDDGKGFDPMKADRKRSGLHNMTKRMTELGGTCVVISQPGKGCTIEFSVPLKQSRWQFWDRTRELNEQAKA
ncbi:MAG: ATP-binding protein [Verrucomicrobiota bacterium]